MYKTRKVSKKIPRIETCINGFLSVVLICGVVPIFMLTFAGKVEIEQLLLNKPDFNVSEIERKLPKIVAKQISMQMPKEAIKAQCVIARTQLMAAMEKSEEEPVSFSESELQDLWGKQYEIFYQKLTRLIEETSGKVLRHDGALIYAPYHQASAGNTREMKEYYEKSQMPYLKSVACHEDTTAKQYLNVFFWTKEEFLELCKTIFPEDTIISGTEVVVLKRDSMGYVLEVQVGQTIYEGENFRKKLNLPSACFEITVIEEDVRIVTMGQGHGFGLSQHTAGKMAEAGKNYMEILQYFYKDVSISE